MGNLLKRNVCIFHLLLSYVVYDIMCTNLRVIILALNKFLVCGYFYIKINLNHFIIQFLYKKLHFLIENKEKYLKKVSKRLVLNFKIQIYLFIN